VSACECAATGGVIEPSGVLTDIGTCVPTYVDFGKEKEGEVT
jgi:hypothetical protein